MTLHCNVISDRRQSGVFQAKHPTFFDAFEKKWFKTEKIRLNDKDIEELRSLISSIFANFFKFKHANVSPTFISIRAFPISCVYLKP